MVAADASTRPTVATAADQRIFLIEVPRFAKKHCPTGPIDCGRRREQRQQSLTWPTRLQSAVASNEPQRFSSQLFNTQPKERVADAVASDPRFVAVKCRKLPGESASICKHKRRRKHVQGVQREGFLREGSEKEPGQGVRSYDHMRVRCRRRGLQTHSSHIPANRRHQRLKEKMEGKHQDIASRVLRKQ